MCSVRKSKGTRRRAAPPQAAALPVEMGRALSVRNTQHPSIRSGSLPRRTEMGVGSGLCSHQSCCRQSTSRPEPRVEIPPSWLPPTSESRARGLGKGCLFLSLI